MPSKYLINSILKLSPITIHTPAFHGTSCFDERSPLHSSGPLPGPSCRWVCFKGPNVAHKLVNLPRPKWTKCRGPSSFSASPVPGLPTLRDVTREGCQGSVWGGPLTPCQGRRSTVLVLWETYSEPQHFVVLGVHGFAFLSPTPRGVAGVRLCIKCNPPQFKYNVSLSLGGETDCQQMSQLIKGSKEKSGSSFCGQNPGPDQSLRRHHTEGHRWAWPRITSRKGSR